MAARSRAPVRMTVVAVSAAIAIVTPISASIVMLVVVPVSTAIVPAVDIAVIVPVAIAIVIALRFAHLAPFVAATIGLGYSGARPEGHRGEQRRKQHPTHDDSSIPCHRKTS